MEALLMAIALWLGANFDLPAARQHPHIAYISAPAMSKLRIDASPDARHAYARMENRADSRQPVALYDSATKTIYLREGWSGATAAELSELVHEMVHHLQYSAGLKYECAQERERLAYKAQQAWLGLFGRDIFEEFELDPFTLLVMTRCMH